MNETSKISSATETSPDQMAQPADAGLESPKSESLSFAENSPPSSTGNTSYDPESYKEDLIFDRREKAYRLRVVEHKPFKEIAQILEVSVSTAFEDVKWVVEHRTAALVEQDKQLVIKQDEIYLALLQRWLPVATETDRIVMNGDREVVDDRGLYATDRVIKILAEQAKLHGLGAGSKTITPKELGEATGEHILKVMQKLARGQFSEKKAKGRVVEAEVLGDGQTHS